MTVFCYVAQNCIIPNVMCEKKSLFITPDLGVFLIIPADECVDPLISGLYASSFLASSRYNFLYSANFAKLYGKFIVVLNSSMISHRWPFIPHHLPVMAQETDACNTNIDSGLFRF